jgi:hypothetical protein
VCAFAGFILCDLESRFMNGSSDSRQQLFRTLDGIERVVLSFYRLFLWLIVAAVPVVVALVVIHRPWGDGNQAEWFYFSIAVLWVLGWLMSQFIAISRRQNNPWPTPKVVATSDAAAGTWTFQLGPAVEAAPGDSAAGNGNGLLTFSKDFSIPLTTLRTDALSQDALTRLKRDLARGLSLDEACQLVEPAFAAWSGTEQRAYLLYVASLLNEQGNELGV